MLPAPAYSPVWESPCNQQSSLIQRTDLLAATQAMQAVYQGLRRQGSSARGTVPLMPFSDLTQLMGFQAVWDFDKRHAE